MTMNEDLKTLGIVVALVLSVGAALVAFIRTRDTRPLTQLVEAKIADVELTTDLELKFANLDKNAQEAIMKLIRVADPFTDYWPGDLDGHVLAWIKEITDKTPLKDKPKD